MDRLTASYLVTAQAADIEARAQVLAVEQSVEMPLAAIGQPHILSEVVGAVQGIEPAGDGCFRVDIGLSYHTLDGGFAQLLNMLFGNSSLQLDVTLVDADLTGPIVAGAGPRYGADGLRKLLRVPADSPLVCAALKPQGSTSTHLAELAGALARGGVHVIKDDHGIANQAAAPFAERVSACQRAVQQANEASGNNTLYAPSLVGSPRSLFRQAAIVRDLGIGAALVAPQLVGLATFAELVGDDLHGVAVIGHPSLAGLRIDPALLIGKLFRLAGADAVIFPNYGGRFSYSADTCRRIATSATAPLAAVRGALPTPAGGITLDRVDELLAFYGNDVMLLIGGALLAAGDELETTARALVTQIAQRRSLE